MDGQSAATRGRVFVQGERYASEVERFSGGGEKHHPFTVEQARARLQGQVTQLLSDAQQIPEALRAERIVFETTILPNYLANSYFPGRLVQELGLSTLGSKEAFATLSLPSEVRENVPTKSLILAGTPEQISRLGAMIVTGGRTKGERRAVEELRQFSEVSLPEPETIIDERAVRGASVEDVPVWEAVLHPDPTTSVLGLRAVGERTFAKFAAYVESLGGMVLADRADVVGGLTFVPIALPEDALDDLARFNPLRSVGRLARLRPMTGGLRNAPVAPPIPPNSNTTSDGPDVLVFDGGIDDQSPYFKGWATAIEATSEPSPRAYVEHGSAVTSTVLYGQITPGQQLSTPSVNVLHFRVMPSTDDVAELYSVLDTISTVLEGRPNGQIVNLSVGPDEAMETRRPHRWTARLDELAYDHDALIVVAAGNNGEADAAAGLNRVQTPADMANGLSVGACGSRNANPLCRAPYSAVGPGRAGSKIQPAGLEFGGSPMEPFLRLDGSGTLSFDWGTSYSAPLVTHGLGKLANVLGDDCNAAALKAFAIHFATPGASHLETGYGRLRSDYDGLLDHDLNEVTVLYNISLKRDEVAGLAIPIPAGGIAGDVGLRYTVAFLCPTQPSESTEYTTVGVEPVFRPNAAVYSFADPADPKKVVKVDVLKDPTQHRQLLTQGWRQSGNPASRSPKFHKALELDRREHSGKWETVIRVDDRMRGSGLLNPRLDINYISREGGAISRSEDPLRVAVVVTLTARPGVDLFNPVQVAFPELVGMGVPVQVQAQT